MSDTDNKTAVDGLRETLGRWHRRLNNARADLREARLKERVMTQQIETIEDVISDLECLLVDADAQEDA